MCALCGNPGLVHDGPGAPPSGDGGQPGGSYAQPAPDLVETSDAAGGTGTTYNPAVNQIVQGQLGSAGDHDWYRVNLVAGQTYTFALVGTGVNDLRDPELFLRNSAGTLITSNDDGGPGLSSAVTYTATATGTYYLDAAAWNNSGTGQYGLSITQGNRAHYDVAMGGGAVDADVSWSATPGTGATVTYGFRQSVPSYSVSGSATQTTFSQLTAQEIAATQLALQLWSDVANITFTQVNPGGYTDNATILFSNYSDPNDGAGAFAFYPGSTASTDAAGDVYLNTTSVSTSSLPSGSYSAFAIVHEIGHTLGLSHPGDYNAAPGQSITYANNAQFIEDSQQYSVMSYFDDGNTGGNAGSYPDTPLLLDVYAAQQIYGPNMTTRTGDTVYGFGSNAGAIYDFAINSDPVLCIWDAGGTDTLNCSGFSQNQLINLTDGLFSNIGGLTGNVSIAIGATIENAVGGSGADTINGNSADNILFGGAGIDTLNGGSGNDALVGDSSADTMVGGTGNDIYYVDNLGDTVVENANEGTDQANLSVSGYTLPANVENGYILITTGLTLTGNGFDNILYGNSGNDTLYGAGGNDTFLPGGGVDSMAGGAGNDVYYVDNLSDVIIESAGEGTEWAATLVSGYTLPASVENGVVWTLMGQTLTGNSLDNILNGNAGNDILHGGIGNDTLNGGAGADTMRGGVGNDVYYVDGTGDVVIENAGEGTDLVAVTINNYALASNVENGVVWTANGLTLLGNELDNILNGGAGNDTLIDDVGNDTLNGGAGAETMAGGTGNELYYVDNLADTVVENVAAGTDTVIAQVSGYTLAANVENGSLWVTNGTLTGNSGNNTLNGWVGNETLNGYTGSDLLNGWLGDDILTGGAGNDTFFYQDGDGRDTITDFTTLQDVTDLTHVTSLHTFADVQSHAAQVGSDTVITIDANNTITLTGVQLSSLHPQDFLLV